MITSRGTRFPSTFTPRTLATLSLATLTVATLLLTATPARAGVDAVLGVNEARLQGTHTGGQILLFTPDPVSLGSSVSHWDSIATPNLLMEPSISQDLAFLGLDITPALMQDIGWQMGTSTFEVISLDPPGQGFTDPTPFPGAPGNPATTLGEARINLFNAVMGAWADTLESPVDIQVLVTWTPLPCIAGGGAVLAAAGPTFIFRDFPGAAEAGTWYHAALAEAVAGQDLTGDPADGGGDIIVFINSDIDEGCLAEGTGYYYGLDGNPPSNLLPLTETGTHELGHGLGFSNFTNEADGQLPQGLPSIYDLFTFDHTQGKSWDEMTNAERVASAANPRQVTWTGAAANAAAQTSLTGGVPELTITSPMALAGTYEIGQAIFGPPLPAGGIAGEIACLKDDAADPTVFNGCTAAVNPGELAGKIALIDRGICNFTEKAANAQAAGAIAAIIVNNAGKFPLPLGGVDDGSITIPVVSLGRQDGNRIRQELCGNEVAFIGNRFQITAHWATANNSGTGKVVMLSEDSGYFYFFDRDIVEVVFKVVDACGSPAFENFWFFAAGLTNVQVDLTVTDTQSGEVQLYSNPRGQPFAPIQDTGSFATCP